MEELIDRMGSSTDGDNQCFRRVVQSQRTVDDPPAGVPAPVGGSMLLGAAALLALRRLRAGAAGA